MLSMNGYHLGIMSLTDHKIGQDFIIRIAKADDVPAVVAMDEAVTGLAKPDYWQDIFDRYGGRRRGRYFLVADHEGTMVGFIIGEVRAWEFGSPPCGWVFTLSVDDKLRLGGIGTALFQAVCDAFRKYGVTKVRTTVARDNDLVMSFFRSQGMMASSFLQLEIDVAS